MFVYRPPKSSVWGHSLGSKDALKNQQKLDAWIDAYFERVEWQSPTGLILRWKSDVLPKIEWAEEFLKPGSERLQQLLFVVNGYRVGFPIGIVFPISTSEPPSYEFLGRFGADAPFKMSPKHFQVGIRSKNGKFAWRKPDEGISGKLEEFIV